MRLASNLTKLFETTLKMFVEKQLKDERDATRNNIIKSTTKIKCLKIIDLVKKMIKYIISQRGVSDNVINISAFLNPADAQNVSFVVEIKTMLNMDWVPLILSCQYLYSK